MNSQKIIASLAVALFVAMAVPAVNAGSGGGSVNNKLPVLATFDTLAVSGGPAAGARSYNNPTTVEFSGTVTDANKACDLQTVRIELTGAEVLGPFTRDLTQSGGDCNVSSEPGSYDANGFKAWKSSPNTITWKYTRSFAVSGSVIVTPSAKDEASYQTGTALTLLIQDKITLFANPVDDLNADLGSSAKWGAWTADPGAVTDGTNYVRITNSGVKATQQFTLDFSGDFTATGDSIPLANAIKFDCREGASSATPTSLGMTTPSWGSATSGSTGTLSFSATGNVFFCRYQVTLPAFLVDASYSTTFTATAA